MSLISEKGTNTKNTITTSLESASIFPYRLELLPSFAKNDRDGRREGGGEASLQKGLEGSRSFYYCK